VASLFDERNDAVRWACGHLIEAAHAAGRPVGICGQAPSDYPEFAAMLVEHGIDSISLNPDAVVRAKRRIAEVEGSIAGRRSTAPPADRPVSTGRAPAGEPPVLAHV